MVLCLQILSAVFIPEHRAGPISPKLLNLRRPREEWSEGCISLSLTAYQNGRRPSFQSASIVSAGDGKSKLWLCPRASEESEGLHCTEPFCA